MLNEDLTLVKLDSLNSSQVYHVLAIRFWKITEALSLSFSSPVKYNSSWVITCLIVRLNEITHEKLVAPWLAQNWPSIKLAKVKKE